MHVAAPTVGRFVQVNLGDDSVHEWRPALVVAVWPGEYTLHPTCYAGLNVQVFLDGMNDACVLERLRAKGYEDGVVPEEDKAEILDDCRRGMRWMTSVPHDGAPRGENPAGWWVSGPRWRWPPLPNAGEGPR